MTYALVVGNTIQSVGGLPQSARRIDTGQWVMGLPSAPAELVAACGYLPVVQVARPADTPTTTFDRAVTLDGGVPTETWTERPKTQAELDGEAAQTNRQAVIAAIKAALADLDLVIADTTAYIDLPTPTNAQAVAQVRDLCLAVRVLARNERRLVRLAADDLVSGAE